MLEMTFQTERKHAGRFPVRPEMTSAAARKRADFILREARLSAHAERVIRALATGGVLTVRQLNELCDVSARTLRKYHSLYYLDRLPILSKELCELGLGEDTAELLMYKLGQVGEQIATRICEGRLPSGYTGYGTHRIIHDIITNEIVMRIATYARGQGWVVVWRGVHQATIFDERGVPALKPDAMLSLTKDSDTKHFFLEYHNEDFRSRAAEKVDRYERVVRDGHWKRQLGLHEIPAVLVIFRHRIVGQGYQDAVNDKKSLGLRCRFLANEIQSVGSKNLGDFHSWWDLGSRTSIDLLST